MEIEVVRQAARRGSRRRQTGGIGSVLLGLLVCAACDSAGEMSGSDPVGAGSGGLSGAPGVGGSTSAAGTSGTSATVGSAGKAGSIGMSAGTGGVAAEAGASGMAGMSGGSGVAGGAGSVAAAGSGGSSASSTGTLPPVTDVGAKGPYALAELDSAGPDRNATVFYPKELGKDGVKHPIAIWGNGAGGTGPNSYRMVNEPIAEHGFVVYVTYMTNDGSEMLAGLSAPILPFVLSVATLTLRVRSMPRA